MFTKAAINLSIAVNNVAGATVTLNLNSLQLAPYQIVENGNFFDINFGDSPAHATAIGNVDDCTLVFT